MIFKEPHPENSKITCWGCPRFSLDANMYLIDWFRVDGGGLLDGASIAKGDYLEWIKTHPREVLEMQEALKVWQKKQIPY